MRVPAVTFAGTSVTIPESPVTLDRNTQLRVVLAKPQVYTGGHQALDSIPRSSCPLGVPATSFLPVAEIIWHDVGILQEAQLELIK